MTYQRVDATATTQWNSHVKIVHACHGVEERDFRQHVPDNMAYNYQQQAGTQ